MQDGFLILIRVVFTGLFLLTVAAGVYMVKNDQKLFGRDRSMPSEGVSSRAYSKLQIWAVWAHALIFTAAFALLIH